MNCYLVLEDGSVFPGRSFGAEPVSTDSFDIQKLTKKGAGEVVFNTGMSGYHEILTDPSYSGQLVLMTYPHIGNYGDDDAWSEVGPGTESDSYRVKLAGFIVRSHYDGPTPDGRMSLDECLKVNDTPGITDVDTRALTLKTRDEGSKNGVIVVPSSGGSLTEADITRTVSFLKGFPSMEGRNLIGDVGSKTQTVLNDTGKHHVVLVDCGVKMNIVRLLTERGCKVTVVPHTASAGDVTGLAPDGVMISNGPGDPRALGPQVALVKQLIGKLPVFGICLGHQLISLALGASIHKMKFGHHGINNPVRDEKTGKVFVTSQNHGFATDPDSIPGDVDTWFMNANDGSVEGLIHKKLPVLCAQFHPEAAPGPNDANWIFDEFVKTMQ